MKEKNFKKLTEGQISSQILLQFNENHHLKEDHLLENTIIRNYIHFLNISIPF